MSIDHDDRPPVTPASLPSDDLDELVSVDAQEALRILVKRHGARRVMFWLRMIALQEGRDT